MEWFEKAHVFPKKTRGNDSKSDENMKKQLKQMLFGYKNNDIEAIKSSTSLKPESDDAVSVHSYSVFESMSTNKDSSSALEVSDPLVRDASISDGDANTSQDLAEDCYASTVESDKDENDSDYDVVNSSAQSNQYENNAGDMSLSMDCSFSNVSSDSESYLVDDELSTTTDSYLEPQPFDENGELASKILENLGRKGNPTAQSKQTKKAKFSPVTIEDHSSDIEEIKGLNIADNNNIGGGSPADLYDDLSIDSSSTDAQPNDHRHSPAFVLIEADENASTPSFQEILRDYKYSTIQNMASVVPIINGKASDLLFSSELIENTYQLKTDEVNISNYQAHNENLDEENMADSSLRDVETQIMDFNLEDHHDCIQSQDILQRAWSVDSLDNSLTNPIKVYCCKNSCIIVLKHPTELYMHGKVKITPLGGTVQIHGCVLSEPQEVYAPNCNFALQIQTLDNETSYYGLFGKLTAIGLSVIDTEDIVTSLGEFDAVLKFDILKSRKIDFVENSFTVTDLFTKQGKKIDHCLLQASELLSCSLYLTKPYRFYEENPSWSQAVKYGLSKLIPKFWLKHQLQIRKNPFM